MPKRAIARDDILKLKFLGGPRVSPSGSSAIYSVRSIDPEKNKYFSHLWMLDLSSQKSMQFTFGEVADGQASWSADSKKIAFTRTKEKKTQIWVMPADGGEARQLTKLEEGAISSLSWSPDGKWLLFAFRPKHQDWTQEARKKREESGLSNPPRVITNLQFKMEGFGFIDLRQHIWICNAQTGEAQAITDGEYDDFSPAFSPDGKKIAFFANRSADPDMTPFVVDLWLTTPQGGRPKKIETPLGYKSGLSFSPDGKWIAYAAQETKEDHWYPAHSQVWLISADGSSKARSLTASIDRTVGNTTLSDSRDASHGEETPLWSRDGSQIYFSMSDQGSTHLYSVSVKNGSPAPLALTEGALDLTAFDGDPRDGRFVALMATPTHPAELFTASSKSRGPLKLTQTTQFNCPLVESLNLCEPEEIWAESSEGAQVHGWLLKPNNFKSEKKYPLLLYIHGGPHAQYGTTFFHELQWHAARGYLVLYTNPRGSRGYSEEYATAIRGDWGNRDYQDLMAAVDHIAQRPYVDKRRMGVAGGSYGGYMTNWIIGHNDRFACAVTDRSVVNMQSMFATCDFAFMPNGYWAGEPWDNFEKLRQQSPLSYVKNAKTPVLIVHSEGDLRCPIEQAEQLFVALKRKNHKVVFVRYPQETNHGLSRGGPPDLRLDRLQRIADWLDQHLKP